MSINIFFKKSQGITLIALIVTIIVLIILAGVSINLIVGENRSNNQRQGSKIQNRNVKCERNHRFIKYKCSIKWIRFNRNIKEQVLLEDAQKWDVTLKKEIINWKEYEIAVNELSDNYVKNNFIEIVSEGNYVKDIYYIKDSSVKEKTYIYDKALDMIYKINKTKIWKYEVHSIEELNYLENGGERQKEKVNYTKIVQNVEIKQVRNKKYYEPDLNNLAQEVTSLIFYKIENGNITSEEYPVNVTRWLNEGKPNEITENNKTYILYDYEKQIWANIRIVTSSVETNWTWIPRYAYLNSGTTTNIAFINNSGSILNGESGEYTVAPAFEDNNKYGMWVSKYEPTSAVSTNTSSYIYYIPDVSTLDKENTYLIVYSDNGQEVKDAVKLSTIKNINQFANSNNWFDYYNKKWANIKINKNGVETWWVWIPRYIYRNTGTTTDIILVGTDDKPLNGSKRPEGYELAPAFEKDDGKKGIWVSKYEPTNVASTYTQNINVKPDISTLDKNYTEIAIYSDDGKSFVKFTKLSEINNLDEYAEKNNWYNYANKKWANIKVTKNGVETWWVWVPRYVYCNNGNSTDILLVGTDNKLLDGSAMPKNYELAPAFELNDGKKGMWVSKYEPTEQ